jgi:hypothetical protein
VKLYILSKRHQKRHFWACDACDTGADKKRAAAVVVVMNGDTRVGELRICVPCAREIARSAEPQS